MNEQQDYRWKKFSDEMPKVGSIIVTRGKPIDDDQQYDALIVYEWDREKFPTDYEWIELPK